MTVSETVRLEASARQGSSPLTMQTEADEKGWQKSTIWLPVSPDTPPETHPILARVRQSTNAKTTIEFRKEKAGYFGILRTGDITCIAMPGSQIRLPDTQVDMPGDPIQGFSQAPLIPTARRSVQQVTDQAMILGAGLASRFVPISGDITGYPKPGVPLLGEDSVIVVLAKHLYAHGIRRIYVNTYYKPHIIKSQLTAIDGLSFVFIDEEAPSGTAGGLVKALQNQWIDQNQPILIMQGDAVTNADISELLEAHAAHHAKVTIGVKTITDQQVNQMAIVVTDQSGEDKQSGSILYFKEKPSLAEAGDNRTGSIGFYVIAPEAYDGFVQTGLAKWNKSPEFDYAMDYFPSLVEGKQHTPPHSSSSPAMWAHVLKEPFYWSDIGRPDQYLATVKDLYCGLLGMTLPPHPEAFYDQGVVYWHDAKAQVQSLGGSLKGNMVVLRTPSP